MDLTGEEAARIYLTPIARLKVFPPHLRALVELSVRTPIPIALNKDTSTLADILERLPEGVEMQYGYAIARAITNGEESGVPCLHALDVPHCPLRSPPCSRRPQRRTQAGIESHLVPEHGHAHGPRHVSCRGGGR